MKGLNKKKEVKIFTDKAMTLFIVLRISPILKKKLQIWVK